jgi:hypothetical protein
MGVHRFGLLLSRYTTKAAKAPRRRAVVLAAAAVVAGGMWLTAPVASAGSPQCGSVCINLFNQKFGTNQYYLSITDKTLHWSWSQTVTQPDANPRPQTADWIVERTKDRPLAEFGTVEFTNCYWSDGTSTSLSPLTNGTLYDGTDPSGYLQTLISPIGSGGIGPGFTVTWLHS